MKASVKATVTSPIAITAITEAIDQQVNGVIGALKGASIVREYRAAGKLDDKTARGYYQVALMSKASGAASELKAYTGADTKFRKALASIAAYNKQVTETGVPAPGSAFQRAVTRLMNDSKPGAAEKAKQSVRVPAEIQAMAAKLWAMCAEYEAAGKLCSTAIANAKVSK